MLFNVFRFFSWFRRRHARLQPAVAIPANSETLDPMRGMTVVSYLQVCLFVVILAQL